MIRPSAQPRERNSGGGPSSDGPAGPGGARSRWGAFAGRYGWRAYALPLLTAVSVVAVYNISVHRDPSNARAVTGSLPAPSTGATTAAPQSSRPATPASTRRTTSKPVTSSPRPTPTSAPLSPLALPAGPAFSMSAQGSFSTLPGSSGVVGKGRLYRFTIDVEDGVSGANPQTFATTVMSVLSDQRSWTATDAVAFQRVDSGPVDFRISLTAPLTVRPMCGYSLRMETSCYAGGAGRVVINLSRWVRGAQAFGSDLTTYRHYLVNHEVGHAVGRNHAHYCLDNGLAPIMMQQTIGLKTENGRCRANAWPFPPGAPDAPGAEQAGDGADAAFFQRNSS